MTALQQDRVKVVTLLIKDYNQKKAAYSAVPALANVFEALIIINSQIDDCLQKQLKDTTGVTKTKAETKTTLASSAYAVVAGIQAYANREGDSTVLGQVNFTEFGLHSLNDQLIIATCNNIYNLGIALLPKLADFGVDNNSMLQLKNDIDACEAMLAEPQKQKKDRSVETMQIGALVKKAFDLIRLQGDKLIVQLKTKDEATYNSYQVNRALPHATKAKAKPTPAPAQPNLTDKKD